MRRPGASPRGPRPRYQSQGAGSRQAEHPPPRLPRWLFRLAAPCVATLAADTSMVVSNAKAEGELGWKPEFASYREGLAAVR